MRSLMNRYSLLLISIFMGYSGLSISAQAPNRNSQKGIDPKKAVVTHPKQTVYDFSLVDLDGKEIPLSSYKGKLLLIVNLASKSIFRDQIEALNELHKTYADQGLVILGIPSADFAGEELNDSAALGAYYHGTAHVTFPIFAAATLRGVKKIPLYRFLTDGKQSLPGGDIHWNFTKFLIDRQGLPLARFEVHEDPAEMDFHVTIERALEGKLKKKTESGKDEPPEGEDDSNNEE